MPSSKSELLSALRVETKRIAIGAHEYSHRLSAATTPMPVEGFGKHEPGLMTQEEFLKWRNPSGKYHPSSAYNYDVAKLNPTLREYAHVKDYGRDWGLHTDVYGNARNNFVIIHSKKTVAVLAKGVLYYAHGYRPKEIPKTWSMYSNLKEIDWKTSRKVKYPEEYIHLVSDVAKRNRDQYSHLLQNVIAKGQRFQLRSEGLPKEDKRTGLAIINNKGEKVAFAADEWGATLITVAREYQRHGFGKLLAKAWYKHNPNIESGGFTPSGERNAIRAWEDRVLEFLSNGWYSQLARKGKLPKHKLKEILDGLSPSAARRSKMPEPKRVDDKGETLIYLDDPRSPVSFVVYDSRFLQDPEDEKYILGYGFFRDSPHVTAPFLYRIDYARPQAEFVTKVALQIAKDNGEKIYVGDGFGDMLEYTGIPGVEQEGDLIKLTRNLLPLQYLSRHERELRKQYDKYGEMEAHLLETAERKWA